MHYQDWASSRLISLFRSSIRWSSSSRSRPDLGGVSPNLEVLTAAYETGSRVLLALVLVSVSPSCSNDEPVSQCGTFEKCGGDVEGTWRIGNSCVEGNLTALANLNPQLPIDCQRMYRAVTGAMSGSVTFASGVATIDTKMTIEFQTSIDAKCAAANEVPALDATNCQSLGPDMVPVVVKDQPHTAITCSLQGGSCDCVARDEIVTQETRDYAIANSSINYTGSKWPLDFCVNGNVMQGRQFDSDLISTIFIEASR